MRFFMGLCAMLSVCGFSYANMGPQGFYAYPNKYFVETGSYVGDGIQKALNAGFPEIHSLEIDGGSVNHCRHRFRSFTQVHVWHKDSGRQLFEVIENINEPITFWLDGHNGRPDPNGGKNTPLLAELDQIKMHSLKNHTILIDDMHCCATILFDYMTQDDIINKVLEINPDYIITFVPGGDAGEYPVNVLVAQPPEIAIKN